jgi:hypothetical protein
VPAFSAKKIATTAAVMDGDPLLMRTSNPTRRLAPAIRTKFATL